MSQPDRALPPTAKRRQLARDAGHVAARDLVGSW